MPDATNGAGSPTVVLVHGAFADASSWNGVIERLQEKGIEAKAPANPLRGSSIDSAYLAGVLEETPGPVVAVGHSYAGAVISTAAKRAKNVVGLGDDLDAVPLTEIPPSQSARPRRSSATSAQQ
jgi:pimeloyl-ACP methyl ester carboxylesterase